METETTSFLTNFVERIFKDPQSFDNCVVDLPSLQNNKPDLDKVRQELLARKYRTTQDILEIIAITFPNFYRDICTKSYTGKDAEKLFAEDTLSGHIPKNFCRPF